MFLNNKRSYIYPQYLSEIRPSVSHVLSKWPCGVMVSTLDSESSDPSSNLGRTCKIFNFFKLLQLLVSCEADNICCTHKVKLLCFYPCVPSKLVGNFVTEKVCARCGARTHDPGITRAEVVSV